MQNETSKAQTEPTQHAGLATSAQSQMENQIDGLRYVADQIAMKNNRLESVLARLRGNTPCEVSNKAEEPPTAIIDRIRYYNDSCINMLNRTDELLVEIDQLI